MKKSLLLLCLISVFTHPVFSQKDSSFWSHSMIKINPLRMISGIYSGEEYGGIVQFPLIKAPFKVDAYIGGGGGQYFEAQSPDGRFPLGFTIRGGLYYFFTKEKRRYLSFQYFFRRWFFNNIIDYSENESSILDPGIPIGGGDNEPDYRYNATVNVNCYDIVYGSQILHSEKIIVDWYVGCGLRIKYIQQAIIGNYHDGQYYPEVIPNVYPERDKYPDIKAGFMVGFVL